MRSVEEGWPIEHPIIDQASKSSFKGLLRRLMIDLIANEVGFIISNNGQKIFIAGKFAMSRLVGSWFAADQTRRRNGTPQRICQLEDVTTAELKR